MSLRSGDQFTVVGPPIPVPVSLEGITKYGHWEPVTPEDRDWHSTIRPIIDCLNAVVSERLAPLFEASPPAHTPFHRPWVRGFDYGTLCDRLAEGHYP